MSYTERMTRMDLWHLSQHYPIRPETWELRYRTWEGERARAIVQLHGLRLHARLQRHEQEAAELRSRDAKALAHFLSPDRTGLRAVWRQIG